VDLTLRSGLRDVPKRNGTDSVAEKRIRPKRTRWPARVFDRAQEIYNERPTPSAAELADRLSREQDDLDKTPEETTLRDWIAKRWITIDENDGPWSMEMSPPEDARLVLEVVRLLIEDPAPRRSRRPSREVARWIARIRRAYPDLDVDLYLVYRLAVVARRGDVGDVETFLAFTPWRDDGAAIREAYRMGLVDDPFMFTFGLERHIVKRENNHER
jgi:hypothetical protein